MRNANTNATNNNQNAVANVNYDAMVFNADLSQGCFNSPCNHYAAYRIAECLSQSTLVPQTFIGNPSNCLIALELANRIKMSPLMVMQNLAIIYGRPSLSAQLLIATFNNCGKFTSIKYRMIGEKGTDSYGCVAYATEKESGELVESDEITIALAKKEGWFGKSGSKWQTMPGQMLRYRAASFLVRTTAPELALGYMSQDEAEDVAAEEPQTITADKVEVVDKSKNVKLAEKLKAQANVRPATAVVETPKQTTAPNSTAEVDKAKDFIRQAGGDVPEDQLI